MAKSAACDPTETKPEIMRRYVEKTRLVNREEFGMRVDEAGAIYQLSKTDRFNTILLAFEFGFAKGQRALRAKRKKGAPA